MVRVKTFGSLRAASAAFAAITVTASLVSSLSLCACISTVEIRDGEADARTAAAGDGSPGSTTGQMDNDGGSAAPLFPNFLPGTNLSGAEFASTTLPGVYGTDYTYPTHAEIDEFTAKGFRIFRIPFLWERLQPTIGQMFSSDELGRLNDIVTYATGKGAYVLVDPHDFARYNGGIIGSGDNGAPSTADFAELWGSLAVNFMANPKVIFGLMNEPSNMATELWLSDANAAIASIRAAGATNVIFVPGNGYTGAHDWTDPTAYGSPNSTIMLGVVDPLDRYVYEVHQYNDSDSSGTNVQCVTPDGSARLIDFTNWLVTNHKRGFLGEFATTTDPSCDGVVEDTLSYIDQHRDVWLGWTWWSAGPWWGTYMFTLEPMANGMDEPQMATLLQHL